MKLEFRNHTPIANKWLIVFSGINKNAVDKNGKKLYEQHAFHIPKRWISVKWSRSMIKQMLAYMALSDSEGNAGVIHLDTLATYIGCSTKTVQNNNRTFEALQLIERTELWSNLVCIKLSNYRENFLDLYASPIKGGSLTIANPGSESAETKYYSRTGYTTIKREAMLELLGLLNVNELRIACRSLYLFEKEVNVGGNPKAYLTYNDLKGILPKYYVFKANIKKTFKYLSTLFNFKTLEEKEIIESLNKSHESIPLQLQKLKSRFMVSFQLHEQKNSRLTLQEEIKEADSAFDLFFLETKVRSISNEQKSSLVSEFGIAKISQALDQITTIIKGNYSPTRSKLLDDLESTPVKSIKNYITSAEKVQLI